MAFELHSASPHVGGASSAPLVFVENVNKIYIRPFHSELRRIKMQILGEGGGSLAGLAVYLPWKE